MGKAAGSSDPTVCGICKDKSIMSAFSRTLISPLIGHKGERLSKLLWWTGIYGKGKDNAFCFSLIVRKMNHHTDNERLEMWANAVSHWPYLQWRLCVATVGDPRTVVGVWNGVIHIQHLSGSTDCAVNTPSSACFRALHGLCLLGHHLSTYTNIDLFIQRPHLLFTIQTQNRLQHIYCIKERILNCPQI